MGSPLPPDPYLALGVSKTATTDEVKKTHRKLVLKCHPDKVTDPAAKQAASDQFHKIQTAYEILVDEERRARYDAQIRLAELRKDALERQGSEKPRSGESRAAPSPCKSSSESVPRNAYAGRGSERVTPQYEERRPSYAADYFDQAPRATARKEPESQRTSRRSGRDTKEKSRTSTRETKESQKEKEREMRREDARKAEQEARRERDRKYSAYAEEDSESDSDEYNRRPRKVREEEEAARKAKEAYYEQAYKQKQEATNNNGGGYFDERTRKMFAASADAWDYIRSSRGRQRPESERRPSPVRMGFSKDKVEYVQRSGGRPAVVVRRGSQRPKATTRDSEDSRKASSREKERRSSPESSEERPQPHRRAPTLSQSKSSPADLHIPSEKQRSQSLQHDTNPLSDPDIPRVKRSGTMPYDSGARRTENVAPPKTANARSTEIVDGLPTPAATPTDYNGPAGPNSTKFNYGRQYADDVEYPTPDGYRTELRQPEPRQPEPTSRPKFTRKTTRSPSPTKEGRDYRDSREPREPREARDSREDRRERTEKARAASSRYPASQQQAQPPPNLRSTSYVYNGAGQGVSETAYERSRPASGRGADPREPRGYPDRLYGEVRPATGSPRQKYNAYEPPEDESSRYQRTATRPENIRVASGYGYKQRSADRPNVSRNGSGNNIYTSVRA